LRERIIDLLCIVDVEEEYVGTVTKRNVNVILILVKIKEEMALVN
jgi:hypothetical protein